ncbi:18364_t:CDS:2 [Entrophospora sp. SA101]|nr:18364_t:CDS:2 [Entrophospora sp. SA101]
MRHCCWIAQTVYLRFGDLKKNANEQKFIYFIEQKNLNTSI